MVKEILVSNFLTEEMINAGRELLEKLDEAGASVDAAFWYYFSEEDVWKLIISSELVNTEGPKKYYQRIVSVNDDRKSNVSLNNIGVTDISNQIVQLLKTMINTGPGISNIRFSRNTINGIFIDDVYIYRINIPS